MIKNSSEQSSREDCEGEWYHCGCQILQNNRINTYAYGDAVRNLLTQGHDKFRNSGASW